jgi:hypothetical protein
MQAVPVFRSPQDTIVGVLMLINKRGENFCLDDARKLEHFRTSISAAVECIGRYACLQCAYMKVCTLEK